MSFSHNVELWREYVEQSRAFSHAMTGRQAKQRIQLVAAGFVNITDGDVRRWRDCAKRARDLSAEIVNQKAKENILSVAASFERTRDLAGKLKSARSTNSQARWRKRRRWLWLFDLRQNPDL